MIFSNRWLKCCKCGLCSTRRNVVMGRGSIPARVLFIGEAPGKSEDLLAQAFIGPSGKLLDIMIKQAWELNSVAMPCPDLYIINVLGCRPCDKASGPNREPRPEEVFACLPRLKYLVDLASPYLIILLGKVAEKYCKKLFPKAYTLPHPAYLLRRGGLKAPEYLSVKRDLADILNEVVAIKPLPWKGVKDA